MHTCPVYTWNHFLPRKVPANSQPSTIRAGNNPWLVRGIRSPFAQPLNIKANQSAWPKKKAPKMGKTNLSKGKMLSNEVRMSHGWSDLNPKKQKIRIFLLVFLETRVNYPKSKVPPFKSLPRSKYSSSLCVCTSGEASQFHWTATIVDENLRKLDTTGRILCICRFLDEPRFWCFGEKGLVILGKNLASANCSPPVPKNSNFHLALAKH